MRNIDIQIEIPPKNPTTSRPPPRARLNQHPQPIHLPPQRPNLQNGNISLDIRPRPRHLLLPALGLEIQFPTQLLPFLRLVLVAVAVAPVPPDLAGLVLFQERRDEEQGGVEGGHDVVVEALVAGGGEPPFEGDDEEEDLDEVEGGDEDVFVGGADELERLLREEGHVFVDGVVGDVGVGGVVERDEDVEEDWRGLGLVGRFSTGMFFFFWVSGGTH